MSLDRPHPDHHPDSSAIGPWSDPGSPLTNRWPQVIGLAVTQSGVVSREQLKQLSLTHNDIEHEIQVGRWSVVAPRVVALQNAPLTREQTRWLGVLHAGPCSALTHASASEAAGLTWTVDPLVHVMTARGDLVSPLPGLRFHQSRRSYRDWLHPTAEPRRLRVEHAALLTAERDRFTRRAIGLLAAHVQQRITTAERMLQASLEIPKLRRGTVLRLALGDIAGGAHSFAEIDVGRRCAEAGLRPPDRQAVRLDRQGRRRYLDCEWVLDDGSIVVLEVDGSFHMRTEHWWRDMHRERAVVISGRRVLRCSSVELRLDPTKIIEDLRAIGVPRIPPPRFVSDRSA
jgi:hypothetical protein